jgi:hypothetical protein
MKGPRGLNIVRLKIRMFGTLSTTHEDTTGDPTKPPTPMRLTILFWMRWVYPLHGLWLLNWLDIW